MAVPEDLDPAEAAPLLCAGISTFSAWTSSFLNALGGFANRLHRCSP